MIKRPLATLGLIALAGLSTTVLAACQSSAPESTPTPVVEEVVEEVIASPAIGETPLGETPADATYTIDGQSVTLTDGSNSTSIPNSSASVVTQLWGTPKYGALTPVTTQDAGVILTQDMGGSGTFWYVAASLEGESGYVGTNAILVGDRVAPQTMVIEDQTIIFNYAVPPAGAPETADASEARSSYYQVQGGVLVEIMNPNI